MISSHLGKYSFSLRALCRGQCFVARGILAVLLSGCSGLFQGDFSGAYSVRDGGRTLSASRPIYIQIAPVIDRRDPDEAFALNRDFQLGSEVTGRIERILARRYQSGEVPRGYEDNVVTLQAKVIRWDVSVVGGTFQKEVEAIAQIELELLGADNGPIYRARYQADTSSNQPFAFRSRVQSILFGTMDAAVGEIFADPKLYRKLSRASIDNVG